MTIQDFVDKGITVINDMGEKRQTTSNSIVFSNGLVASIIDHTKGNYSNVKTRFSVAVCDYNGYFDWEILIPFGADNSIGEGYGCYFTDDEEDVCRILSIIENMKGV